MGDKLKMVPAVCTQCGGTLDVDPSQESAKCPFCGMTFVVEKAINNYNVQHATIEHADHVTVDMRGSVKSVLDFAGKQMSEQREMKKELKKQEQEFSHNIFKLFVKVMAVMFIIGIIAMVVMNIVDPSGDDGEIMEEYSEQFAEVQYYFEDGLLYVDVPLADDYDWEYSDESKYTVLASEGLDENGYHFSVTGGDEDGIGYAVFAGYSAGDSYPVQYSVFEVKIENAEIIDVIDAENVTDLSESELMY